MTTDAIHVNERAPVRKPNGTITAVIVTASVVVGMLLAPLATSFTQRPDGPNLALAPVALSEATPCDTCEAKSCEDCPTEVAARTGPKVIPAKCCGCGKCVKLAPRTFAMDSKTGKAVVINPKGDSPATIARAAKACPTDAITTK